MYSDLDVEDYIARHPDIGCTAATDHLRRDNPNAQSHCYSCPFIKCIDDLSKCERRELKKYHRYGVLPISLLDLIPLATYIEWRRDIVNV